MSDTFDIAQHSVAAGERRIQVGLTIPAEQAIPRCGAARDSRSAHHSCPVFGICIRRSGDTGRLVPIGSDRGYAGASMDQNKGRTGNPADDARREMLRLQAAAQLAAQARGTVTSQGEIKSLRPRVTREPAGVKSLLVVDDEPSVIELVDASLDSNLFKVVAAESVSEARSILQSHSDIALVLTDLRMPGEDGFSLLEFLRSNLRFHHIPSIVLTSCSDIRFVRHAIELGAQAYLAKPFTREALVERITGVLESSAITIVLVSDNHTARTILGRDITLAGYTVQTAENGARALELIKKGRVSLIISELVLEDMTGLDLLGRASDAGGGVPFLFISDPQLKASEEIVKAAGGYGLIRRPFRNSEVVQMIRAMEPKLRFRSANLAET